MSVIWEKNKPHILIVDDNPTNIDILVNTLKENYRLGISKNGEKTLIYAEKNKPDLILLDIMLPDINGYEVCKQLKENHVTKDITVIFITSIQETASKTKGFEIGAVDYITKPFNSAEVKARVETHLSLEKMREELRNQNIILKHKIKEKTNQLSTTLRSTINVMAQLAESRDPYTAGHQQRVSKLASAIAERLSLTSDEITTIRIAAILHDIGKIRIPVDILNRPGKLLDIEFSMLKIHPKVGFDLLNEIPFSRPIAQIVLQHHEKLDGSGYPLGLVGDEIFLKAKILAVADVMEAMSSHRPYRPALGEKTALKEIIAKKGTHFDPDVAEICRMLFEEESFSLF